MTEAPYIVIPCKPFGSGKSRLAPALGLDARRRLAAYLLKQTLDLALEVAAPDRVHVVTSDASVCAVARSRGARTVGDSGGGLNEALSAACLELRRAPLVILPIDLPLAKRDSILSALAAPADVVIVPDRHGSGTNLLRLGAPVTPRFAFGSDSARKHRRLYEAEGLSVAVMTFADLAFDLDTPDDIDSWMLQAAGRRAVAGIRAMAEERM
jgi:2-phospho-L-lactate guanylyltransferase